tara:strand:- start:2143 stop:2529 length:387 start_codon:yes stop_codon:yes gene_type:complete
MSVANDDYAVEIDLPAYRRGNAFPGIYQIGPVVVDDATPALSLARIRCHFKNRNGTLVFAFDSDASASPDAPISIDDANTWQASIAPPSAFITSLGVFDWDMEFYSTGLALPQTFYKGSILVLADITT